MNPLVVGGVALGGLLLYESTKPHGIDVPIAAGSGDHAFAAALRARGHVAGVAFTVPGDDSPLNAWMRMRDALVTHFGSQGDGNPAIAHYEDLVDVCDAWLEAYSAGRSADATAAQNLALFNHPYFVGLGREACGMPDQIAPKTPLGVAVCELEKQRDYLNWSTTDPEDVSSTMAATLKVASELEGADFTIEGARRTDQTASWSQIGGGLEAAGVASARFVGGVAGDAAGAIAGAVVGSSLFWLAVFGVIAWKVAR